MAGGFDVMMFLRSLKACVSVAAIFVCLAAIGCSPIGGVKITAVPSDLSLKERVVFRSPGWVSNRVVVLDISGVLMNARTPGLLSEGEHGVSLVVEKLNKAASDSRVKAVVLRINSPGGTVTASDILYQEIKAFRDKTGRPVVAYFQDVAASGAYYLSCASDEIIAQRTTVTGSIGVIMQMVDLSGVMGNLGITSDAIKSGPFKDAGSPFREMKPDERAVFQAMVDDFYQKFVSVVDAGRPKLSRDQILKLADGRVYTADQALKVGLIDRIGTLNDAIDKAKDRAGIEAAHVVMYRRPTVWAPNMYARAPGQAGPTVNLFNINLPFDWTIRPQFMYIWDVRE